MRREIPGSTFSDHYSQVGLERKVLSLFGVRQTDSLHCPQTTSPSKGIRVASLNRIRCDYGDHIPTEVSRHPHTIELNRVSHERVLRAVRGVDCHESAEFRRVSRVVLSSSGPRQGHFIVHETGLWIRAPPEGLLSRHRLWARVPGACFG